MEVRGFSKEFMLTVLEDDSKIKIDEPTYSTRYSTEYLLIFEHEDCLWQTGYEIGHGDDGETPFQHQTAIECVRVWERPVESVEYITEDPDVLEKTDNN